MLKSLNRLGVTAFTAVLLAAPARAATVIDFGTGGAGAGGTIIWNGTDLIVANVPIGSVTVFDAPMNNGVYLVNGNATGSGGGLYGSLDFYTIDNNLVSITGCIPGLGVGTVNAGGDCTGPVPLLQGRFGGWGLNPSEGFISGSGSDNKNTALLDAIGISPGVLWSFRLDSFATGSLKADGTPAISTHFRNAGPPQDVPVPEPSTMMLLGTGLLAAFRARRTVVTAIK